jgi:hypothetical protein
MRELIGMATALLLLSPASFGGGTGKHLFILSGQSNMVGLNPAESFTPAVRAAFGRENVTVIKDAEGGKPIQSWYKEWKPANGVKPKSTGDLYNRLMNKVNKAIAGQEFDTVTFIWMQGEADTRDRGDVYARSLRGLVEQLSADLRRDDVNLVVGRISDYDIENATRPHWTMVRRAQVEFAEDYPRGAWVNTDDLNDGKNRKGQPIKNDLHYSGAGYKELGKRFAERAIEQIKRSDNSN